MVTAVSILAHIGQTERFPTPEDLISYAGLAPGIGSPTALGTTAQSAEAEPTAIYDIC